MQHQNFTYRLTHVPVLVTHALSSLERSLLLILLPTHRHSRRHNTLNPAPCHWHYLQVVVDKPQWACPVAVAWCWLVNALVAVLWLACQLRQPSWCSVPAMTTTTMTMPSPRQPQQQQQIQGWNQSSMTTTQTSCQPAETAAVVTDEHPELILDTHRQTLTDVMSVG